MATTDPRRHGRRRDLRPPGRWLARYSTDVEWLVPHFEKMLTDQALLARAYLHAWQVTGRDDYRQVVLETLDYVLDELGATGGGPLLLARRRRGGGGGRPRHLHPRRGRPTRWPRRAGVS